MKKILLIISLGVFLLANLAAQTVALHSNGNTQIFKGINAFKEANNAAANGDTLYLSGGNFTMPPSFNKILKIYGVGHAEQATTATGSTYINADINLKEGADDFHIEGVNFNSLSIERDKSIKNLVVKRCNIRASISITGNTNPSEDLLVTGSIIHNTINVQNAVRVLLSNNIINSTINNTHNNIIKNNIFVYKSTTSGYSIGGSNNHLSNNIFIRQDSYYRNNICSGDGNQFYNNAFVYGPPNFGTNPVTVDNWFPIDLDVFFIDYAGGDYHLTEPANYIGEDGTQIGVFGGMYPYKVDGVPVIPYIESATIPHKVDESGKLPVNIKVKAQKEQD